METQVNATLRKHNSESQSVYYCCCRISQDEVPCHSCPGAASSHCRWETLTGWMDLANYVFGKRGGDKLLPWWISLKCSRIKSTLNVNSWFLTSLLQGNRASLNILMLCRALKWRSILQVIRTEMFIAMKAGSAEEEFKMLNKWEPFIL